MMSSSLWSIHEYQLDSGSEPVSLSPRDPVDVADLGQRRTEVAAGRRVGGPDPAEQGVRDSDRQRQELFSRTDRVPSNRAILGPIMPIRSSEFAVSTSAEIEPGASLVSGLATRIQSAPVAADP
jgi:hypothetical protein